jgi:hypothetical protein
LIDLNIFLKPQPGTEGVIFATDGPNKGYPEFWNFVVAKLPLWGVGSGSFSYQNVGCVGGKSKLSDGWGHIFWVFKNIFTRVPPWDFFRNIAL